MFKKPLLLLSSLFALSAAQAITIDTFDGAAQVQSTTIGTTAEAVVLDPQIVGGVRALRTTKLSGPLASRLETGLGVLNHSQDAGTAGLSTVIWDGDTDPSNINFSGLSGLNFTRDGGSAFRLNSLYFDFANNLTLQLEISVFDSSDPSGATFAQSLVTLDRVYTNETLQIPFSSFVPTGAFSFVRVGAVQLKILGINPSVDLTIDSITTDGDCTHAPASGASIKDDCEVCDGHNEAMDQCGVCFGNNMNLDQCGVCFGNNVNVDDCGVCFGNNTSKDICGICGGNGTSCLDCAGIPHGIATADDCGICGGDGASCRQCDAMDLGNKKAAMLADAQRQHDEGLFFALRIKPVNKKLYRKTIKRINAAYAQIVNGIAMIPDVNLSCQPSQACITQNSGVATVNALRKQVKIVYDDSIGVLSYQIAVGDGVCRGDLIACRDRVKSRAKQSSTLKSLAKKLYRKLKVHLNGVPVEFSVCSPAVAGVRNQPE